MSGRLAFYWFSALVVALPIRAAGDEKQIDCGVSATRDAVVITRVTVGNLAVPCKWVPGQPDGRGRWQPAPGFPAADDWLQNTTIYLFNRTNKTIVVAGLVIGFPQTGDGRSPASPQLTFNLSLGLRPDFANFSPRTGLPMPQQGIPLSWSAGRIQVIRLSEYADQIRRRAQEQLSDPVTSISINLAEVVFEDGMSWSGGSFHVPDPQHPGKLEHMPQGFFPGDPKANWPAESIGIDK